MRIAFGRKDMEEKSKGKKIAVISVAVSAVLLLAIVLIGALDQINGWLLGVLRLLRPVLIGLAVSYLCNPYFRFFERKVFFKLRPPSLRRTLSLICTYLLVLLIIALILLLIIPQLLESIAQFASNYDAYLASAIRQVNKTITAINDLASRATGNDTPLLELLEIGNLRQKVSALFGTEGKSLMEYLTSIDIKPITAMISEFFDVLADSLFGFFISLYLLSTKEKRYAQIMKLRRALFNDKANAHITRFCTIADRSFGGFLEGKLLDSLIIGVLAYVALSIFGIPYALLLSTFIGITNIVPIIGPIIGAIPSALILLLSAPEKVIPFIVIVIVLQQLDGNVIGPKILGNNTGVSSLCVMIAITMMGSLWGFVGMLLGVPLFATLLELTDEYVVARLQKKGLPSGVENYYSNDALVDPSRNAHLTTDKAVQKLERRALRISRKQENGEKPTRLEKLTLDFYSFLRSKRLIAEMTDEEQTRYSAEEARKLALRQAEEYLQKRRTEQELSADDVQSKTGKENA